LITGNCYIKNKYKYYLLDGYIILLLSSKIKYYAV